MSKYIATRAMRGATALVNETEAMLQKALAEKGPDCKVAFPNTAYYLPTIFGMTGTTEKNHVKIYCHSCDARGYGPG